MRFLSKETFLPKRLCWTRKGRFDNPSETFLPKSGNFFFKVRECCDIVNIWKKVEKHFWKRRMQFWQPLSEISTETPGIIAQSTKVKNFFEKNLRSLKLFYWLRKHKNGNRAANYLLNSENLFDKVVKKYKRHASGTNNPQNISVDKYNVVLAIPSRYKFFINRHSRATYWISENKYENKNFSDNCLPQIFRRTRGFQFQEPRQSFRSKARTLITEKPRGKLKNF